MIKTIEIVEAIQDFRHLIEEINKNGDQYILEENGKVLAAVISPTDFENLIEKEVQEVIHEVRRQNRARERLFKIMDEVQKGNESFTIDEVERDVEEAIKAVRRGNA